MLVLQHGFVRIGDHRTPRVGGRQELKCCAVDQAAETRKVAGDAIAPKLARTELLGDHQTEFCPGDTDHLPPMESDVSGLGVASSSQQRAARWAALPSHVGGGDLSGLAVSFARLGYHKLSVQTYSFHEPLVARDASTPARCCARE